MRVIRVPLAAVLCLGTTLLLASSVRGENELVQLAHDRVTVTPPAPWKWAILRMTGPGEWERTEIFDGGEPIVFQLVPGRDPAEGRFDWELTSRPLDALDATARQRFHGSFRVQEGAVLPPPDANAVRVSSGAAEDRSPQAPPAEDRGVTAAADQHIDGNLTLSGGLCAGCASGTSPNVGTPVDAWFKLNHRVAFGNGTDPTLALDWDDTSSRLVLYTPNVMGDPQTSFGEYEVGLSTANLPKEMNLAGKPVNDPVLLAVRSNPEIRFQAVTDSTFGGVSTRDWDVGASTGTFWVRDATADTYPLFLEAGATGQIRIADGGIDIDGDLFVPEGAMTARTVRVSSSRAKKEDLVPVDEDDVLRRLTQIPVYEWSFRQDDTGTRHVGPVAEEFHAAVALPGQSAEYLSVTDLAGLSLAAIQALERRVASLEAENGRLAAAIEAGSRSSCARDEDAGESTPP